MSDQPVTPPARRQVNLGAQRANPAPQPPIQNQQAQNQPAQNQPAQNQPAQNQPTQPAWPQGGVARGIAPGNANPAPRMTGLGGQRVAPPPAVVVAPPPPVQAGPRPLALPPNVQQWNDDTLRDLGWQSKVGEQRAMQGEMLRAATDIHNTAFPIAKSESLKGLAKGSEHFTPVADAFTLMASGANKDMMDNCRRARQAAQAYIDYADNVKNPIGMRDRAKRKDAARDVIDSTNDFEARFGEAIDATFAMPRPPWDSATEMKAASIKAATDLMTLPDPKAKPHGGGTANQAFWIERGAGADPANPAPTFLFKPQIAIQHQMGGFPPGGDPAREALSGRAAELLRASTNLDFNMPDTHVVGLPGDLLPGTMNPLTATDAQGKVKGSLQAFAASAGEFRDQPFAAKRSISPQSCQKAAILDTVLMNCDRHAGNFMVDATGGTGRLIPIDHGFAFPGPAVMPDLMDNFGGEKNVLLTMPGSYQPFDQASLDGIAALDPDLIRDAMQGEIDDLQTVHPETAGMVSPAALDISRRATMFLKLAAPTLSPAIMQAALGQHGPELLDTTIDDATFTQRANAVIAQAAQTAPAMQEYFLMPSEMRVKMRETLGANGWPLGQPLVDERWMFANIELALKLFKANTPNPALVADLQAQLGNEYANALARYQTLQQLASNYKGPDVDASDGPLTQAETTHLDEIKALFPGTGGLDRVVLSRKAVAEFAQLTQMLGVPNNQLHAEIDTRLAPLALPPFEAAKTHDTVPTAWRYLLQVAGLGQAGPALAPDQGGQRARELALDYVASLLALLNPAPAGLGAQHAQLVQRTAALAANPADADPLRIAVETLQDQALEAVRTSQRLDYKQLAEDAAPSLADEGMSEFVTTKLSEIKSFVGSGNALAVPAAIRGLRALLI